MPSNPAGLEAASARFLSDDDHLPEELHRRRSTRVRKKAMRVPSPAPLSVIRYCFGYRPTFPFWELRDPLPLTATSHVPILGTRQRDTNAGDCVETIAGVQRAVPGRDGPAQGVVP